MEKDRSSKIVAIIALVVASVGLTLGFAAFQASLVINPEATVKGDESQFKVEFSTLAGSQNTGTVEGTKSEEEDAQFTAEEATLSETTVDNLKANFTKPGQTVEYEFYVRNNGQIPAYLTSIDFEKTKPTCTASTATQGNVDAVCDKVKVTVNYDSQDFTTTSSSFSDNTLAVGTSKTVKVKLSLEEGATAVDGDYTVDFGSITFKYDAKAS